MKTNRIKVTNYPLTPVALIADYALMGWDNLFAAVYLFLSIPSPLHQQPKFDIR